MARRGYYFFIAALTLLPVFTVYAAQGGLAPFWFLAGDAYLYLGIAQNSEGLSFSFDGEAPTNGFHPFWQIWLRLLVALLPAGNDLALMQATLASAVILTGLGAAFLGSAIARLTGSWVLALFALPGVYFLLFGQGLQNLPLWAFFDGMEAALVTFLAGLLALLIARFPGLERATTRDWLGIGTVLALIVFARLDEALAVFALGLTLFLWPAQSLAQRLTRPLLIGLPAALIVLAYMGWSHATTGELMPVSGAAKGEGALMGNIWVTLVTFLAPLQDLRAALTSYEPDRLVLLGASFRVVQLLVPAVLAVIWGLAIWRWFRHQPWAALMIGLGSGVVLKASYNFLKVNYWHQAYWYFALALAVTSLAAALLLAPSYRRLTQETRLSAPLLALVLGAFGLLHASFWGASLLGQPRHATQLQFWQERDQTAAILASAVETPKLLEFGDGVVNFSLPHPVRHGFVFAGDVGSLEALQAGRLLRHSLSEGYQILTSYEYLWVPQGAEDWQDAEIRAFLATSFLDHRVRAELGEIAFEMLHVWRPSPDAEGVPFIGMRLRGEAPTPEEPAREAPAQ